MKEIQHINEKDIRLTCCNRSFIPFGVKDSSLAVGQIITLRKEQERELKKGRTYPVVGAID